MIRSGSARTWALVLPLLLAPLGNRFAAGQDEALRRPPEPFRVFVYPSDPADTALKAKLEEVLPTVRERVERRRHWFRLADSPATADLTLSLVNYRTGALGEGHPHRRTGDSRPGLLTATPNDSREYHFVDAVVQGGVVRAEISGLYVGLIKREPDIRGAADHLARELERFCKENYAALTGLRMENRPHAP